MVRGSWELSQNLGTSLRSLEALTREYRDDPEAWYLLGDAYYHVGMLHGIAPERVDSAFRRAIAIDSTFAPAYLHLVEDAFQASDSAQAGILIRALARFDSASPKTAGLQVAWALAFGTEAEREQAQLRMTKLRSDALLPAKHAMNLNPDLAPWTETVGRAIYAQPAFGFGDRAQGIGGAAESYELRGRFREAWTLYRTFIALRDSAESSLGPTAWRLVPGAYRLEGLPAPAGWEAWPTSRDMQLERPAGVYIRGVWAIAAGRWPEVDRAVTTLRQAADTLRGGTDIADSLSREAGRQRLKAFAAHLQAWAAWVENTSASNLERFAATTDSLNDHSVLGAGASYVLGRAYFEAGELDRSERYMLTPQRWSSGVQTEVIAPREYYLGRIAEERGHRAEAQEHYARFVRWWRDCDPELKPMWEDGRQRLASASGEPRP